MPGFRQSLLRPGLWFILVLVFMLAACRRTDSIAPTALEDLPEALSTGSALPVPTETRMAAAVTENPPSGSAVNGTVSQTLQETVTPTPASKTFDGMPQGLTARGFPYLGDPEAPVTLVDYSDFL